MKTHKLFEAAGVAVLLVSWFLEWSSAKTAEAEKQDFVHNAEQFNVALMSEETSFDIEVCYMKTCLASGQSAPKNSGLRDFESVWSDYNFRKAWSRHVLTEQQNFVLQNAMMAAHALTLSDEDRSSLEDAKSIQLDINTRFSKGLNDSNRNSFVNSPMFPHQPGNASIVLFGESREWVPEIDRMTAQEADFILRRLVEYQFTLQGFSKRIMELMDEKAEYRFWIFRFVYSIGTVLVIGAFVLEAFSKEANQSEKRKKHHH